ncbi:MAG: hypothetical protein R2752_21085 [Vicinamibacterales bacterium]
MTVFDDGSAARVSGNRALSGTAQPPCLARVLVRHLLATRRELRASA